MHALADDPTDLALMQAVPLLPVPQSGRSPAIAELLARPSGHGFLAGHDGVFLHVARPWLSARVPVSGPLPTGPIYGAAGPARLDLLCGLIPGTLVDAAADLFRSALPNEAGGFIVWNDESREFALQIADVLEASPSRLSYKPPLLAPGWHIVADIHSHGAMRAFWSATDDADDIHHTRISMVVGKLDAHDPSAGELIARLAANGVFAPMPRPPTADLATLTYRPVKPIGFDNV
jgi:PRTRC genetic system protein A